MRVRTKKQKYGKAEIRIRAIITKKPLAATNIDFFREISISIAFSIEIDICQRGDIHGGSTRPTGYGDPKTSKRVDLKLDIDIAF